MCQQRRRDTRKLLFHCLQKARNEGNVEDMSYLRERLRKMDAEDSFGIIIRSRHKESLESEKLSLDHLNKEMKRGKTVSLSKISKIENKKRITLSRLLGRTPNWHDREIWFSLSNNTLKYKAPPQDVLVFPFLSLV